MGLRPNRTRGGLRVKPKILYHGKEKFKFDNPESVIEVSKSPLDRPEPGNRYTIFDCICQPFQLERMPRKKYQITAVTPLQAARMAIENYRKDYGQEIK